MTSPTRLRDWQERFEAFTAERRTMPFQWGANDCCTFAAACVEALTGMNICAAGLRDHTDALQAYRAVEAHGGIAAITTAALGDPVAAAYAAPGDVVLVDMDGRDALAICNGTTALMPSDNGLVSVCMTTARCAWRLG
jgi:hypothetical protein